jgi:predicted nucleic acid-binding protein
LRTVFDASCLINAFHGGVLELGAAVSSIDLCFGPLVRSECKTIGPQLDTLVSQKPSRLVDDTVVPGSIFIHLQTKYGLGPGETESLSIAKHLGWRVSCDDRLARSMIEHELGKARLTGTTGLLGHLVGASILTTAQASEAHAKMIAQGAFLPPWP